MKSGRKYPVKGLQRHGKKWRWRKMVGGRKVSVTFEADDEAAAIAWVLDMQSRPELLDVGAWEFEVERYISESVACGKLSEGYGGHRAGVLLAEGKRMGLVGPRDLTVGRLQAWYDAAVADGRVCVVSVNHYLTHFRGFGEWLVAGGMIFENPARAVRRVPNPDNSRDSFLSAVQVGDVLSRAREHHEVMRRRWPARSGSYPLLELFFLLTCECGMRKGEADAARAEWVDLERGVIVIPGEDVFEGHVWHRKGRSGRRRAAVVPMVAGLIEWFAQYGVPEPFLLMPEKRWGRGVYRYDIRERVRRFLGEDFPGVTIHDLRRSFAANRVSAGTSIEKVANWMGISIQTAWARYARFLPADAAIENGAAVRVCDGGDGSDGGDGDGGGVVVRSVRERLVELVALFEDGLVSEEDFETTKKAILFELRIES